MATQILKTVKPSGGDYTSLAQAISDNAQDLVTNDSYLDIEIDGDWSSGADTTVVDITGYTTDATRYINIYTTATARHSGKWDSSKYRLVVSSAAAPVIGISSGANHVRITGLQIKNTYYSNVFNAADGIGFPNSSSSDLRIDKCIVYAEQAVLRIPFDSPVLLTNSVFVCLGATDHQFGNALRASGGVSAYNCVFANTNAGSAGTTVYSGFYTYNLYNCYSYNAGSADAYSTSGLNLTTCASDDATGSSGLTSIAYSTTGGAFFTSVTSESEDYHLQNGSALADVGTDVSGTITDDIDGDTRSGDWDIGVDSFAASSSSSSCSSSSSSKSSSSSSSSSCSSSSSSCSSSSSSSRSSSCSSSSSSSRSSSSSSRSSSSSSVSSSSSSQSSSSSSSSSISSSSSSSSSQSSSSSSSSQSSSSSSSSLSSSSSCRSSSSSSSSSQSSSSSSSSAFLGPQEQHSREDVTSLPTDDSDLATAFTGGDYVTTRFQDGVRIAQSTINAHAMFLFKNRGTSSQPFTATWVGISNKDCSIVPAILEIYNRTSGSWEELDRDSSTAAGSNITLTGTKLSTIGDYLDVNFEVACRVRQASTS